MYKLNKYNSSRYNLNPTFALSTFSVHNGRHYDLNLDDILTIYSFCIFRLRNNSLDHWGQILTYSWPDLTWTCTRTWQCICRYLKYISAKSFLHAPTLHNIKRFNFCPKLDTALIVAANRTLFSNSGELRIKQIELPWLLIGRLLPDPGL